MNKEESESESIINAIQFFNKKNYKNPDLSKSPWRSIWKKLQSQELDSNLALLDKKFTQSLKVKSFEEVKKDKVEEDASVASLSPSSSSSTTTTTTTEDVVIAHLTEIELKNWKTEIIKNYISRFIIIINFVYITAIFVFMAVICIYMYIYI